MKIFRNWIEERLERRINWISRCIGIRSGRKYYEINFKDGTSKDYFIDFDNKTIEEV